MSRHKTKAENIRNPEHYFNSMIKKELERDRNKTAKYHGTGFVKDIFHFSKIALN